MNIELTEQETRMLKIMLYVCSLDQREHKTIMDDYDFPPEERFVMKEILEKLGGEIPAFDMALRDRPQF